MSRRRPCRVHGLGRSESGDLVNMETGSAALRQIGRASCLRPCRLCRHCAEQRKPARSVILSSPFRCPKSRVVILLKKDRLPSTGSVLRSIPAAPGEFSVSIIPHTLKMTTLRLLEGRRTWSILRWILSVNMSKNSSCARSMPAAGQRGLGPGIDAGFLAEHGFFR